MTESVRLVHALSNKEGHELVNVKFFLGDDRNITQEALCEQAANARQQISLGLARPKDSIDSNLIKTTVDQFIK